MKLSFVRKISIKRKIFFLIFVIPAVIISVFGAIILENSRTSLERELFTMRNHSSSQVAQNIGQTLSEYDEFLTDISNDSSIVDILKKDHSNLDKSDISLLGIKISDADIERMANIYVLGFNDFQASSNNTNPYILDEVQSTTWYSDIIENPDDIVTTGTYIDDSKFGIFRRYITKSKIIVDYSVGEPIGIAIMDISELVLELDYMNQALNNPEGSTILVVDEFGDIISSRKKTEIGKNYFDIIGQEYIVSENDSYSIIYDNVLGMDKLSLDISISYSPYYLVESVPLTNVISPIYNLVILVLIILVAFILLMLFVDIAITKWITSPIIKIEHAMQSVIDGDLTVSSNIRRNDELGKLAEVFDNMVVNTRNLITSIKEKEQLKLKAELDFLQAQINPHFMYNTLSSIRFMISMGKASQAEDMLIRFSKMLRYITDKTDKHVTLDEELQQIKNYIEILKIRYPDSFFVSFDIPSECDKIEIPSFILQPIVENAVYHNVGIGKANVKIRVRIRYKNQILSIRVTDNGKGISKQRLAQINDKSLRLDDSVGVENVDSRIKLNFGEDSGIIINSKVGLGTRVDYKICFGGGK